MSQARPNSYRTGPDERGKFGVFGGRYVAETLMPLILEVEKAYRAAKADPAFAARIAELATHYVGRPSPLYFAERMTERLGGAKIYFKREELNHTGSHKVNNCIGQILVAQAMGKKRIIAETGAGQHGVATATVAARFGLQCVVYMGEVDIARQQPNVYRMKLLGAEVVPVKSGSRTLKDAMNEALRDWVTNVDSTYYLIGTVAGPHPYPEMVRDFQSVIGEETRKQLMEIEGRLPDSLVACIGGGSNAMGLFHPFLDEPGVQMFGVEAAGHGIETGKHAASLTGGRPGVLHGNKTYLLQDDDGQILEGEFDLGRPRLSGHRTRAFLAQGDGPCDLRLGDRRGSAGGVPFLLPARRHHPGAGAVPCHRACHAHGADAAQGPSLRGQSLRPGRQGHLHGCRPRRNANPMSKTKSGRIEACFERLKQEKRAALITFISAGDPDYDNSLAVLKALPEAGADIVELGMPFTDPMADGPSVEAAGLRALKGGQTMKKTLAMAGEFRKVHAATPLVLMGYFNPIHSYGQERFIEDAAKAGVDALIVVDLPPEENAELCALADARNIRVIQFATPTTDEKRLPKILERAGGFLYYVSITGVTGAAAPDLGKVEKHVNWLRAKAQIPVAVGFGIRRPDQAAAFGRIAEGVVVGSAIVDIIRQGIDESGKFSPSQISKVTGLVSDLARGIASARETLVD